MECFSDTSYEQCGQKAMDESENIFPDNDDDSDDSELYFDVARDDGSYDFVRDDSYYFPDAIFLVSVSMVVERT
jgi:hypothetical protein